MTYSGYSLVGEHHDYLAEQIRRSAQKAALKKQIYADVELKRELFNVYLRHGYALDSLASEQQALSRNIKNQFSGKARAALTSRFDDNIREALTLHYMFERFLKQF